MRKCYLCGTTEKELRPYGPGGQDVCFPCAMSTPERKAQTEQAFDSQLSACGETPVIGLDVGPVPLRTANESQG